MSKRSDGAVWLSIEAMNILPDELRTDLTEWDYDKEKDIYTFEFWKWNESFPEIVQWEQFFDRLDESFIDYDFVRVNYDTQVLRTGQYFSIGSDNEIIV